MTGLLVGDDTGDNGRMVSEGVSSKLNVRATGLLCHTFPLPARAV